MAKRNHDKIRAGVQDDPSLALAAALGLDTAKLSADADAGVDLADVGADDGSDESDAEINDEIDALLADAGDDDGSDEGADDDFDNDDLDYDQSPDSGLDLGDNELAAILGIGGGTDGKTRVQLHCAQGDVTADLFKTDAWKACQEATGKTPVEFLAQAFSEFMNKGDEATAEQVEAIGLQAMSDEVAAGKSEDEVNAEVQNGMIAGASEADDQTVTGA